MNVVHWYEDVLKIDFTVMGIFPLTRPEMAERFKAEIVGYTNDSNPLTEEIYDDPAYAGPKGKIFQMVGGIYLKLVSGGRAAKAYSEIIGRYHKIAQDLAREARKANGWTDSGDKTWRTTPDGKRTTSNGFPISRYAMPWSVDGAGDFDGTITAETKFTS